MVNIYFPVVFVVSAAKLQLESSVSKGSVVVRIRSVKENTYLCVNSDGNLTVEAGILMLHNRQASVTSGRTRVLSDAGVRLAWLFLSSFSLAFGDSLLA